MFCELGYAILNNSTLPVYFKEGLGIDPAYIGPIMMPFFFSELFKGPLGALADRIGRKPLMVIGPSVTVVSSIAYTLVKYRPGTIFVPTLLVFGALRLLDGLGSSALWPAMFAYLGDVVRSDKRASAMSVLNVTYMVGLAIGFLAGGLVDDRFGLARSQYPYARFFPSFYLTSLLFGIATVFAVVGIRRPQIVQNTWVKATASAGHVAEAATSANHISWFKVVSSVPGVLLLAFVTFFGIGCIALQVKIFALDEFNISETQFGVIFLWPALLIGASAIPMGHLADKWGKVRSIQLGFFIGALSLWLMILLVQSSHVRELSLAISGTLLGLGFVIAFPAWLAYLTTLSDDSRRGTIVGAASMAQALGVLLGTLLGGWLYKHWSSNASQAHLAPFVACAMFLTCGSALSFIVLRRKTSPPDLTVHSP